jgi:micrococcal nuclease
MRHAIMLLLALVVAVFPGPPGDVRAAQSLMDVTVVSIINSGTIEVQIPSGPVVTVRLLGVDAPDPKSPIQAVPCFEPEASARTAELLPVGTTVGLERDIQDSDQYGRIPAYVWLGDGTPMVNEQLIAEGFLKARHESMNVRHAGRFTQAQQVAQANGSGLWSACVAGSQNTTDGALTVGPKAAP